MTALGRSSLSARAVPGTKLFQIVPQAPGSRDGVGDYAMALATGLKDSHQLETVFLAGASAGHKTVANFPVFSLAAISKEQCSSGDRIILHYVSYGYQSRGIPVGLLKRIESLQKLCGDGRLVTIFHELYASAPPWRSAFWLQPLQKWLVGKIARISDVCIVSSESTRTELARLAPDATILVQPVISTLGEPVFPPGPTKERDLRRWIIVGGTHLIERSLDSFLDRVSLIPASLFPNELFVVGGDDNPVVSEKLRTLPKIRSEYRPSVTVQAASEILSTCGFGWIDYFRQPDVAAGAILKSGSHAALLAHGVIPVFPSPGMFVVVDGKALPGPFFIDRNQSRLPPQEAVPAISREIYDWYWQYASTRHLVGTIARALWQGNSEYANSR